MTNKLRIDYYSDVLCVWAWISQRRLQELSEEWQDKIDVHFHFLNLFGDVHSRINEKWADKGLFKGFGEHILDAVKPFDNAPVDPQVWQNCQPKTSSNAHLILKAVDLCYSSKEVANMAFQFQSAFFQRSEDVSEMSVLFDILESQSLSSSNIRQKLDNGTAMAALIRDYQLAKDLNVKGSPTWIMNNGRQELFGNVGYRILTANIKEVLEKPSHQASCC